MDIDLVRLNLNQSSMNVLKLIIAIIMFGVSLDLKMSDFTNLLKKPRSFITGLACHYLLMPAMTFLLITLVDMKPSLALGLIMVAACPGGNLSNVLTSLSKSNTALSVGLISFTTLLSMVTTPFFILYLGSKVSGAESLLTEIKLDPKDILEGVFIILGLPLALGISASKFFPDFSKKASKVLGKFSFIFLIIFVVGALVTNFQHFLNYFHVIIGVVVIHNLLSFLMGLAAGKIARLPEGDRNALTLYMGVRNTALGLALVFQFFDGLGGMAMVVAFWGIMQISFGLVLSQVMKKYSFIGVRV